MKHLAFALSALLVLCGCKTIQSSDLDHDLGAPIRPNTQNLYEPLDDEAFHDFVLALDGDGKDKYLNADHPLTLRAEFWIGKIDEVVRKLDPDLSRGIARPVVKIFKHERERAHTVARPHCTLDPIIHVNADDSVDEKGLDYFSNRTSKLCRYEKASLRHALATGPKIQKTLLRRGINCSGILNGSDPNASIGQMSCSPKTGLENTVVKGGYYKKVFPYITIYTGLIKNVTEEELVAALAHELGHYYRNHDSADLFPGSYNYFFRLRDHKVGEKPGAATLSEPEKLAVTNYLDALAKDSASLRGEEEALAKLGLGQYSTEEEADHFAAEMLANLSLDPMSFVKYWVKEAESEECNKRFSQEFKDESGEFSKLSYIKFRTAHHDDCYRAYSTYKDLSLHNYTPPLGRYITLKEVEGWLEQEKKFSWNTRVSIIDKLK
jgi:hypothetical protein